MVQGTPDPKQLADAHDIVTDAMRAISAWEERRAALGWHHSPGISADRDRKLLRSAVRLVPAAEKLATARARLNSGPPESKDTSALASVQLKLVQALKALAQNGRVTDETRRAEVTALLKEMEAVFRAIAKDPRGVTAHVAALAESGRRLGTGLEERGGDELARVAGSYKRKMDEALQQLSTPARAGWFRGKRKAGEIVRAACRRVEAASSLLLKWIVQQLER